MGGYIREILESGKKNFVFLGEAGCGKTEIAVNFAVKMAEAGHGNITFFDMDQTKPLFRARDIRQELEKRGISFCYEEQFEDARTLVGGPRAMLADPDRIVILDVGGDHTGSRMIGGFASLLAREDTVNYFIINAYRPWSMTPEAIDTTLTRVLGMARIGIDDIEVISNPNTGITTSAAEALEGHERLSRMMEGALDISCVCAMEEIAPRVAEKTDDPVIPIGIYMIYDWSEDDRTKKEAGR